MLELIWRGIAMALVAPCLWIYGQSYCTGFSASPRRTGRRSAAGSGMCRRVGYFTTASPRRHPMSTNWRSAGFRITPSASSTASFSHWSSRPHGLPIRPSLSRGSSASSQSARAGSCCSRAGHRLGGIEDAEPHKGPYPEPRCPYGFRTRHVCRGASDALNEKGAEGPFSV